MRALISSHSRVHATPNAYKEVRLFTLCEIGRCIVWPQFVIVCGYTIIIFFVRLITHDSLNAVITSIKLITSLELCLISQLFFSSPVKLIKIPAPGFDLPCGNRLKDVSRELIAKVEEEMIFWRPSHHHSLRALGRDCEPQSTLTLPSPLSRKGLIFNKACHLIANARMRMSFF